jgi:phosphoenolpyruvate carboxykinase (GTP)
LSEKLSKYMDDKSLMKLKALNNSHVEEEVERFLELCKPAKATVITDSEKDIQYVRKLAIELREEIPLEMEGHTVHYDSYRDQARDKENTRVLKTPDMKMSQGINTIDRDEGLAEVFEIMNGAMKGKECLVRFFSLGPTHSRFTQRALQLTDSAYVAHSEDILYRTGYEEFKRLKGSKDYFTFVHSAGELDERNTTTNIDKRRIYVDVLDGKVYSVNNQYAGNSLGLKKLALRLAIYKANHEDWLTEHMLIMGVHPPGKDRVTYFTGAYPSACGKTSTAMIPGQTIVGDDIAYLREDEEGKCRAVNIESGVFGIIRDVNPEDDPVIYRTLTTPREMIFSNVLVHEGKPYWLGMGLPDEEIPDQGTNHSGDWYRGKKDSTGKEIPLAHPNARYTIRLNELENIDPNWDDPKGHLIRGIYYGGRDIDTNVPISEALNWEHGVYMGATIESETTSATLGKTGVRNSNPMAIMDFMVVPFGSYLSNHINFGKRLTMKPKVFSTNYFIQDEEGRYLNKKVDKKIWILWSEGRVHGEYEAIKTPIGHLPFYEDLKDLFRIVFDWEYKHEDYVKQFNIRIKKHLEKLERMEKLYGGEEGIPDSFWDIHYKIRKELEYILEKTGKEVVPPSYFM